MVLLGITGPPQMLIGTQFHPEWVFELEHLFPDLEIVKVQGEAARKGLVQDVLSEKEWKDVTVVLTGSFIPHPDQAPDLRYVQLQSAGANHVLSHPVAIETDIDICTASGVHG